MSKTRGILHKLFSLTLVFIFLLSDVGVYAQTVQLPAPGSRIDLSPAFTPPLLKGIKVYRNDPFRFDFILDKGDAVQIEEQVRTDSNRLIKYFLASLTVPEKDLWVNLSPYEKDRIVPEAFGQTEMGRDLLAQDYILKQITASVIYPEGQVGKQFWTKVYAEAQKRYGTTDVPVDTFNKVWIVPEKATVSEHNDAAFVVESKLKVMLEEDYLALEENGGRQAQTNANKLGSEIVREVVIPILEKEVNEGKNFAPLRQVYCSLILAAWYKRKLKASILGQAYVDQRKTDGIDIVDKNEKEGIWSQYVEAFKKGAYNFIKEEYDPVTQQSIPRKYFSGGADLAMGQIFQTSDLPELPSISPEQARIIQIRADAAMDEGLVRKGFGNHFKIIQIQNAMTDEGIEAVSKKYQVHNWDAGFTPSRSRMMADEVKEIRALWKLKTEKPLTVAKDLKGMEVAVIGPGRMASELKELIELFPEIKAIHIVDGDATDFYNIDRQLDEFKNGGHSIPPIFGHLVNVLEMPDDLADKIDFIYQRSVYDPQVFSPEQLQKAASQVHKILRTNGVIFSAGLGSDWLALINSQLFSTRVIDWNLLTSHYSNPFFVSEKREESTLSGSTSAGHKDKAMTPEQAGLKLEEIKTSFYQRFESLEALKSPDTSERLKIREYKKFASELGIPVTLDENVGLWTRIVQFNKYTAASIVDAFRGKDLPLFIRAYYLIGGLIALITQIDLPKVTPSYDKDQLRLSVVGKHIIYPTMAVSATIVSFLVCAALKISIFKGLGFFLMLFVLHELFINVADYGHELSHVVQLNLIRQIQQTILPSSDFFEFVRKFDLEKSLINVNRVPPSTTRLKEIADDVISQAKKIIGENVSMTAKAGGAGNDSAMLYTTVRQSDVTPGGIDLNPDRIDLKMGSSTDAIPFNVDPAMLQRMQSASGVIPVIVNVLPLTNLSDFMGIESAVAGSI